MLVFTRAQRGFAYVILLITLAVIGVSTAASLHAGARMGRRSAEEQLLVIGNEFQQALVTYSGGTGAGPVELTELLRDPRFPGIRRHLRRIYSDPLTGSTTWGLRRDPAGRITGIYSLAPGVPISRTGFGTARKSFEEAESYSDWVFGLQLQNVRTPPR